MRKRLSLWLILVSLAVGLGVAATRALADFGAQGGELGSGAQPFQTYVTSSSTAVSLSTIPVGTVLIGIKTVATAANGACGWYDAANLGATANTALIDELYEATSGKTNVQWWPRPYKIKTQLTVVVTSAICSAFY